MSYFLCIVISLLTGFISGIIVRSKVKTSSVTPAPDPMPSGVLIEKIVERAIRDYELNKKTAEIIEDINKYLKEGKL